MIFKKHSQLSRESSLTVIRQEIQNSSNNGPHIMSCRCTHRLGRADSGHEGGSENKQHGQSRELGFSPGEDFLNPMLVLFRSDTGQGLKVLK